MVGNKSFLHGSDRNGNEWWGTLEESKVSSIVTYHDASQRVTGTKSCLGFRCSVEFDAHYLQFGVLDI